MDGDLTAEATTHSVEETQGVVRHVASDYPKVIRSQKLAGKGSGVGRSGEKNGLDN